jgi:hypothetical protein
VRAVCRSRGDSAVVALLGVGFIGLRRPESAKLATLQWLSAGWLLAMLGWTLSLVARRNSAEAPEEVIYLLALTLVYAVISVLHAVSWRIAWIHAALVAHR